MRFILILLLVPLVFAQPQISGAMEDNNIIAEDLDDHYNSSAAKNASLIVTFGGTADKTLHVSANMDIAGMNLIIDNMTSAVDGLSLIIVRGFEQGHLISKPAESYENFVCDRDWFLGGMVHPWRCDFDNDDCVEFENRTSVAYDLNTTFIFRNTSKSVLSSANLIQVPEAVLEAMKNSSGSEYLNVTVEGEVIFTYEFDDRELGIDACISSYFTESVSIPFSLNASFLVAGQQKLFFLKAPVLREQWFRNNHFDVIVLSQSPLYLVDTSLNGNQTTNNTLRQFNSTTGPYGLVQITSNKTNGTWSESKNLTNPLPLEEYNHSFSFIYEFDHKYEGIGKNTLGLHVVDSFLGEAEYEAVILSRMLSYDGTKTETAATFDPKLTRKSSTFERAELSNIEISLGFLALLIILIFVNLWIKS